MGISCKIRYIIPYLYHDLSVEFTLVHQLTHQLYIHRRFAINAFFSCLSIPFNLKYLQCNNGPARYPVNRRKIGTPTYGTRLSGSSNTNSIICLKLKGAYIAFCVGRPSLVLGLSPSSSGNTGRLTLTKSPWPSATRTESNISTWASSTNHASKSNATRTEPSERTRIVPLNHALPVLWKMARMATWGR